MNKKTKIKLKLQENERPDIKRSFFVFLKEIHFIATKGNFFLILHQKFLCIFELL